MQVAVMGLGTVFQQAMAKKWFHSGQLSAYGSQSGRVAEALQQSLTAKEETTDERWEEKLSLCEALARTLLEQTDRFLDPQFKEHADKLERIQRSAARMI